MTAEERVSAHSSSTASVTRTGDDTNGLWRRVVRRRAFLGGLAAAGVAAPAGALLATDAVAADASITRGDVAILRFLAAAEIIESDLWQQYSELGGANGGNASYIAALQNLDSDMPQYISDNADDEMSHAAFLNAYLRSKGAQPVDLERFRTLPSSQATGASQVSRLTNLQHLDVDTSWYTRYRSAENPDLGATFPQAITIRNQPAIPLSDTETPPGTPQPLPPVTVPARRMQAIANTAALHFAFIEVGGSSLYTTMAQKCTSLEVLRIVVSIGGTEVDHFSVWHDKAGNVVVVVDPVTGLAFPDLNAAPLGGEAFQTNLILPEPCDFLGAGLPECSVIRPSTTAHAGAVASVRALASDRLFEGQSDEFMETLMTLAVAADAASRGV